MRGRITVVHLTLDQVVEVRVLAPQPGPFRCGPHRLAWPRTPPSQGGNAGSNPAGATIRRAGKAFCRELSPLACPERSRGACPERSRGAPFGSEPEAQPQGRRHGRPSARVEWCSKYTYLRRPVQLVYSESYNSLEKATGRERQLKRWNRTKKKALIVGDAARLKQLSKRRS